MFKNIFVFVLTACLAVTGCQKSDEFQTTDSGLKYKYVEKTEDGAQPQDGEILTLNLTMITASDSVLMDVEEMPLQKNEAMWSQTQGGIEEAFSLLSKGDSMIVKINAGDLYQRTWRMPVPPNVNAEEEITCQIKLTDILDEASYQKKEALARVEQVEAFRQQILQEKQEQMISDGQQIDAYLEKNNIDAETTESGLRYVILEEGSGPKPEVGDQVKVNYTGNVLEGEYFDTSEENKAQELGLHDPRRPYGPFEFILGTGGVIHGWDEGIALLNEGTKARFYIPSPMAYGDQQRSDVIVANAILEFEVELVDVNSNN